MQKAVHDWAAFLFVYISISNAKKLIKKHNALTSPICLPIRSDGEATPQSPKTILN